MAETFRSPRTIATEKNSRKPGGEPAHCGACGIPSRDCQCGSLKLLGSDPRPETTSKAFEGEQSSFRG